jgi:hypothetical protein
MSNLTPYAAAKLANAEITAAGLKAIPPQMMYNYTTARLNAGKAPLIAFTPEDGVDREALATWTAAYIAKKTGTVVDPAQLTLF